MSDKEMLFYAQAYRTLTKATAEISNNSEDQKRFEIIDWLIKQVEQHQKLLESLNKRGIEIKKLKSQNKRLREALEFYAGGNHYLVYYDKIILSDDGEIARKALEGENNE